MRYLLLDSTYRDRYLYPEPGNYVVPFQKIMGDSINTSVNPSTLQYPIYNFQWTTEYYPTPIPDLTTFTGTIVGGSPTQPMLDASIDSLIGARNSNPLVSATFDQLKGVLRQLAFFFNRDDLELTNQYTVLEYDPINRVVTLDRPIPDFQTGSTVKYSLKNLSTPSRIVLQGYNFDRLGQGSNNSGILISTSTVLYLVDLALMEVQPVQFDGLTSLVCMNGQSFSAGWRVTDAYMLFVSESPMSSGTIVPLDPSVSPPSYLAPNSILEWRLPSGGTGYRINDTVGVYPPGDPTLTTGAAVAQMQVVRVGRMGEILELAVIHPGAQYCCGAVYTLRLLNRSGWATASGTGLMAPLPEETAAALQVTQTAPYLTVQSAHVITANSYLMPLIATPMFVYSPTTGLQICPVHSVPPIISRTVTDTTKTSGAVNLSIQANVNALYGTFPIERVIPLGGNVYGVQLQGNSSQALADPNLWPTDGRFGPYPFSVFVLSFDQDLCVPLNYSGSTVSSSQMVCYGLRIVSLILPNQILYTPYGGLTSSYPFVFVEVTNDSAPSGHNKITLYANNPYAVNSTFICHISDVNSPLITKFIKLFSDGSHQMIKFKPNDNLRFRVSLPNGETFTTELPDRLPPLQPNPLLQLTCLVEMIRLE